MSAFYEIVLTDPYGVKLQNLNEYIRVQYARRINEVGKMTVELSRSAYDVNLFRTSQGLRVDSRIEVWRRLEDGISYLDMDTAWFINNFYDSLAPDGTETYTIEAVCGLDLLDRRIVPYNEGMELLYADKNQEADDMMKAIMEENYGPTALDSDRDLSAWLSIQADSSDAWSIRKSFAKRKILDIFKELAESSFGYGIPLAFDIVYLPDSKTFEFRTYINQRGTDRTETTGTNPLIVGAQYGTLANVFLQYDHTKEKNFIQAGGLSIGQIRAPAYKSDAVSIGKSPFNRKELFVSSSWDSDLDDDAEYALQQNKARIRFEGELIDSDEARYGRNYKWGDKITAEHEDQKYDVYVDAVSVSVSDDGEAVDVVLRSEFNG